MSARLGPSGRLGPAFRLGSAGATASPSVAPASATLDQLATLQLGASGYTGTAVAWSSSDPTVATVSGSGLVTASAKAGPVTITATGAAVPTEVASATLAVRAVSISIGPATASLGLSGTQQFAVLVAGSTDPTYSLNQSGGASISGTGLFTALGTAGSATITATAHADPSKTASAMVTVSASATYHDTANFGAAYAGLVGSIGLAWKDATGAIVHARDVAGIIEIAPGLYAGSLTAPPAPIYLSAWDTGGSAPIYDGGKASADPSAAAPGGSGLTALQAQAACLLAIQGYGAATASAVASLSSAVLDSGTASASPAPTTATFSATGSLHAPAGGYTVAPMSVLWQSGANQGLRFPILGHAVIGSNHSFTVAAMPSAPGPGDAFLVV